MIEFLRPGWLLLAPAVLLVYFLWRRRGRGSPWRAVIDADLLPHLLAGTGSTRAAWPWVLLGAAYLAAVLALAGPSLELPERSAVTRLSARVIVLDLSPSMETADVSPSRLDRARYKVRDLLARPTDVQHGLVAFSGDAFTVSPVTADDATLLNLLDALSPQVMPVAGNRVDRALDLALSLLANAGDSRGHILLVTDGVDGAGAQAAARVRQAGAVLDVLAVGTADGAPVPAADGSFRRDADGNIVIDGVDLQNLSSLAAAGGGRAMAMTLDESDLDALQTRVGPITGARTVARDEAVPRRRDVGPYLVLALLPAALVAFRRGWLLVLLPLLVFPPPGHAFSWQDLWSRPDQQAAADLDAGRFDAAAAHGDTLWRGAALYRGEDFAAAAEAYAGHDAADAHYNRGNALARSGDLAGAVDAYERALSLEPGAADARHNRDLVKRLLEEQQQSSGAQGDPQDNGEAQESGDSGQSPSGGAPRQDAADAGSQAGDGNDNGGSGSREPTDGAQNADGAGGDTTRADASEATGAAGENRENAEQSDSAPGAKEDAGPDEGEQRQAGRGDQTSDGQRGEPALPSGDSHERREAQGDAGGRVAGGEDPHAQQVLEQWLRQVPDDPEGLLRRKFLYQYRSRQEQGG